MEYTVLSKTGSTRGTAYGMSNKIITHEGKTHVVWLDQIHKTYVATYCHEAKTWSDPVFVADGDDNHAGAAMTMDSKRVSLSRVWAASQSDATRGECESQ